MRINSPTPNINVFERNQLYISKCNVRHVTIQVCSRFKQNRRHFRRSPCNPGIHNPDRTSHHKGNLYTVANGAETIDRSSYRFHKYPVFTTGLQYDTYRRITNSEWVIRHKGPFPANPNSERLFKNKCGIQIQE